jgi:hypothetical protein
MPGKSHDGNRPRVEFVSESIFSILITIGLWQLVT